VRRTAETENLSASGAWWGREGFEGPGDDEQGMVPERRRDGFGAGEGECVAAAEHSGEEEAGGEAETGTASDEDTGEFRARRERRQSSTC